MPKGERGIFGQNVNPSEAGKKSGEVRRAKGERIAAILAAFSNKPLSSEEAELIDRHLLTMTDDELRRFASDENKPVEMRRRARMLLQPNDDVAFDAGERLRDRAFGKPRQKNEVSVTDAPPIVFSERERKPE